MARIILIDDNEPFRTVLASFLAEAGHSVVAAGNGFDGMALQRADPADVILTDVEMPYGGLQTIRVLRAEFPELAIIAISGHPLKLSVAGAVGAHRLLAKPFDFSQLAETIAAITPGLALVPCNGTSG